MLGESDRVTISEYCALNCTPTDIVKKIIAILQCIFPFVLQKEEEF